MNLPAALAAAVVFILSVQTGLFAAERVPGKGPVGNTADSLYEISSSDFFNMKKVRQPIDVRNVDHDLLSAAVFHETNRRRTRHRKKTLRYLPQLHQAAEMHAKTMAEHGFVAHIDPIHPHLRNPKDRVRKAGLNIRYLAENVASHFAIQYEAGKPVHVFKEEGRLRFYYEREGDPIPNHSYRSFAGSLLDDWMDSAAHRKNILAEEPAVLGAACSFRREEKGMDKFYCVQLFFDRSNNLSR